MGRFSCSLLRCRAAGGLFQLRLAEEGRRVSTTNRARSVGLKPLVDALAVELVAAREDSHNLTLLKVAHTHNTDGLLAILAACLACVPVARQLLDVALGQPLGLDLSEPLSKREEGLVVLRLGYVRPSQLRMQSRVA